MLYAVVLLLLTANTINIAADIAAMGEALQLVAGGGEHGHALAFGVLLAVLQVFLSYARLAAIFKWLTLTLFAYVGVVFTVATMDRRGEAVTLSDSGQTYWLLGQFERSRLDHDRRRNSYLKQLCDS